MRTIYLIRHGRPEFPGGKPMCLGAYELPLSLEGRMQSAMAGEYIAGKNITAIFSSGLARARESAELIAAPVNILEGLRELNAGEWDGLTFDEIRKRWPELYRRRGEDPSVQPPGAEDRERGLRRFRVALDAALDASQGDIAVVCHRTATQLLLAEIRGIPLEESRDIKINYGSVTTLDYEDGIFYERSAGYEPQPEPDARLCERFLDAAGTPPEVRAHCRAVAQESMGIVCALAAAGCYPDERVVFPAAYLHDMLRTEPRHDRAAAKLLRALGYDKLSAVIRQHHDLEEPERIDEAAVVYIADKLIEGDMKVLMSWRFSQSRKKCDTPEALAAHDGRYQKALRTAEAINSACGKEIIK